jgi:hypothetical protein
VPPHDTIPQEAPENVVLTLADEDCFVLQVSAGSTHAPEGAFAVNSYFPVQDLMSVQQVCAWAAAPIANIVRTIATAA